MSQASSHLFLGGPALTPSYVENVQQELVVVTATLLALLARAASDSCVRAAPANISFAFRFHFQSQNMLFFPCESGNTCGFLSETCACRI